MSKTKHYAVKWSEAFIKCCFTPRPGPKERPAAHLILEILIHLSICNPQLGLLDLPKKAICNHPHSAKSTNSVTSEMVVKPFHK
ncbi:hypothetical protein ACTXT7_017232, partial [Hymenolepis weldensis]